MTKQIKAARAKLTPFKVGDKVVRKDKPGTVLTVSWVCKGDYDRSEQIIATEYNDYSHPSSPASIYVEASL